ncbi:hypothetical protein AOLI_G00303060 [Acnodon oligacanthus]
MFLFQKQAKLIAAVSLPGFSFGRRSEDKVSLSSTHNPQANANREAPQRTVTSESSRGANDLRQGGSENRRMKRGEECGASLLRSVLG